MEKFSDINLTETLRAIMETNTARFKNNFKVDTVILRHVAQSGEPGKKTVLWASYPDGTFCDTEMQVFLKGTYANSAWLGLGEQTNGRVLVYALEINRINKDNDAVYGHLYSLDYEEHVKHVREESLPYSISYMTFYRENGETFTAESVETAALMDSDNKSPIIYNRREPNNSLDMSLLLLDENAYRERTCENGNIYEHIQRLESECVTVEAERITEEFRKLAARSAKPNSPDDKCYMVKVSDYFAETVPYWNQQKLIAAIPFKNAALHAQRDVPGVHICVNANVVKREMKKEKPSILARLQEGKEAAAQAQKSQDSAPKRDNGMEV